MTKKLKEGVFTLVIAGIVLAVGLLFLADFQAQVGDCSSYSIEGWFTTLINETDNEDTAILQNTSGSIAQYEILWNDLASNSTTGKIGSAYYDGGTGTWSKTLVGCSSNGDGLSADYSDDSGVIGASYQNNDSELWFMYDNIGSQTYDCCQLDNDTGPELGTWTSTWINDTDFSHIVVVYKEDNSNTLHSIECSGSDCSTCTAPIQVDSPGGLEDIGDYVSLAYNENASQFEVFYLNKTTANTYLKHAWGPGPAGGPWNTETIGAVGNVTTPNVDAHDWPNDPSSLACFYNASSDTLDLVYGSAGAGWAVDHGIDDNGRYCSLDVKLTTGGMVDAHILYQGNTLAGYNTKHARVLPGNDNETEIVDNAKTARYTDTLIDVLDNDTIGSLEDNTDDSTWFVYESVSSSGTNCTSEASNSVHNVIESLGEFAEWLGIIVIVFIVGVLLYYVMRHFGSRI